MLELCHVVWLVSPGAPERAGLVALGLVPSFERVHPGQGTRNVCFCFDNAYLEVLWIEDARAAATMASRLRLLERVERRPLDSLPFGFAIRTDRELPFATWDYRPPFLAPGKAFAVATDSEDTRQPLIFRPPDSARPDAWTDGRAGARQSAAGFAEIASVELRLPPAIEPAPALRALADAGIVALGRATHAAELRLSLSRGDRRGARWLVLPLAAWTEDVERTV
jgi:hypothetical protein